MQLINELIQELEDAAQDYNLDLIDKVELDLRLQLLISKVNRVEINFLYEPLQRLVTKRHTKPFNQLLFKSKYRAAESLLMLINTNNKQELLEQVYVITVNRLYFHSLCKMLDNSCRAYINKNHMDLTTLNNIDLFTYKAEAEMNR